MQSTVMPSAARSSAMSRAPSRAASRAASPPSAAIARRGRDRPANAAARAAPRGRPPGRSAPARRRARPCSRSAGDQRAHLVRRRAVAREEDEAERIGVAEERALVAPTAPCRRSRRSRRAAHGLTRMHPTLRCFSSVADALRRRLVGDRPGLDAIEDAARRRDRSAALGMRELAEQVGVCAASAAPIPCAPLRASATSAELQAIAARRHRRGCGAAPAGRGAQQPAAARRRRLRSGERGSGAAAGAAAGATAGAASVGAGIAAAAGAAGSGVATDPAAGAAGGRSPRVRSAPGAAAASPAAAAAARPWARARCCR